MIYLAGFQLVNFLVKLCHFLLELCALTLGRSDSGPQIVVLLLGGAVGLLLKSYLEEPEVPGVLLNISFQTNTTRCF